MKTIFLSVFMFLNGVFNSSVSSPQTVTEQTQYNNLINSLAASTSTLTGTMPFVAYAANSYVPLLGLTQIKVQGGTSPYSYGASSGGFYTLKVNKGEVYYKAPSVEGTISVVVTDATGKKKEIHLTVVKPLVLSKKIISLPANTTYTVSPSGGKGKYKYRIISGKGTISQQGLFTSSNEEGKSTILIEDEAGQQLSVDLFIINPRMELATSVVPSTYTVSNPTQEKSVPIIPTTREENTPAPSPVIPTPMLVGCGEAHETKVSFLSEASSGLCPTNTTLSDFYGNGPWTWKCVGTFNIAANCRADTTVIPPVVNTPSNPNPVPVLPTTPSPIVPVLPLETYPVTPDEVLTNTTFANGLSPWSANTSTTKVTTSEIDASRKAVKIVPANTTTGATLTQNIATGKIIPGHAYTLHIQARLDAPLTSANATATIQFLRQPSPSYPNSPGQSYRTYNVNVTSSTYTDYTIDFKAPPYTAYPRVIIAGYNTNVLVDTVTLKMREAISLTEPIADTVGSYVLPGYQLAFNDEFNGSGLNRKKWFTRYVPAAETLDNLANSEQERYVDSAIQVSGGILNLTATKVGNSTASAWPINYQSGMIRSDWTNKYGYYEARVKMAGSKGMWPAFWLTADVDDAGFLGWPPEIDIFEYPIDGVDHINTMLNSSPVCQTNATCTFDFSDKDYNISQKKYYASFDFSAGWHTIGSEWTPTSVTTYVDGKKIVTRSYLWNYTNGSPAGPTSVLLNLAVGGSWAGKNGIDDTALPQTFQVDWVRVYKKP